MLDNADYEMDLNGNDLWLKNEIQWFEIFKRVWILIWSVKKWKFLIPLNFEFHKFDKF